MVMQALREAGAYSVGDLPLAGIVERGSQYVLASSPIRALRNSFSVALFLLWSSSDAVLGKELAR